MLGQTKSRPGLQKFVVALGEVLLAQGRITEPQLQSALKKQQEEAAKRNRMLLGDVLIEWGLITTAELDEAVDVQFKMNKPERFGTEAHHPSVNSPAKRAIDIAGALVGLTVTAVLLPLVALALYCEDRGPVFFKQPRVGLCGKQFKIWKFRSMVPDAERRKLATATGDHRLFAVLNDRRITRVGRFLRKTNLDEFPQFWNVLKGEMSMVGTRPPTLDEVKHYEPHHWQRLQVKPGITGVWQASANRHLNKDFERVLSLDMEYQQQWSVAFDLGLVAKTIFGAVTRRLGAQGK